MSICHPLYFSADVPDPFLARVRARERSPFEFAFRLEPIVQFAARLFAAFEIDFVRATADLLVTRGVPY
jgi:hypothetical protein